MDITTQLSGKLYASKNGNSWLTSGYTTTTAPGSSLTITLTDNAAVIEWIRRRNRKIMLFDCELFFSVFYGIVLDNRRVVRLRRLDFG